MTLKIIDKGYENVKPDIYYCIKNPKELSKLEKQIKPFLKNYKIILENGLNYAGGIVIEKGLLTHVSISPYEDSKIKEVIRKNNQVKEIKHGSYGTEIEGVDYLVQISN